MKRNKNLKGKVINWVMLLSILLSTAVTPITVLAETLDNTTSSSSVKKEEKPVLNTF